MLAEKELPDLVLMNIGLPDGTGAKATQAILARRPETKIVLLTLSDEESHLFEAIRAGAMGHLSKQIGATVLVKTLQAVIEGLGRDFGDTCAPYFG